MILSKIICWMALLIVLYSYVVYPVLIALLARLFDKSHRQDIIKSRSISIVVAVFNEEVSIARRLAELSQLLASSPFCGEIIVVSDGSNDETVERARRFIGDWLRVIELPANQGKAAALTVGCQAARNEILVFADARQAWAKDTLERLVENFSDPEVGAVSGDLILKDSLGVMAGVGLYWRHEKWLRRTESRLHSTVGVSGSISAVRRELFKPIPRGMILDDVFWPMQVVGQGFRVVHDERAQAFDQLPERSRDEFWRKVRTLSGNFELVACSPWVLSPWRNPICFQFISHKLCRLAVPWALLVLLSASFFSDGLFYQTVFWSEVVLLLLALVAILTAGGSQLPFAPLAASFLILNAAAWLAFWVWITGRAPRSWSRVVYGNNSLHSSEQSDQVSRVEVYQ
jgi:poly-beta-1,6-N-acetyl-D-glucosamine synthase